ncbi:NMD protein affecting ribosome stability and mRNA decay [Methanoplanus sp. FWC-SCC4]|uniref:NMD protein affecting ribosome stability and mRNA decay n=1 Tax=Methanochimaera problematica TaxID=2609417 RepID=A0AA97FBG3_9EURY|nr:NMD3-related protein [Methanoplanus sp. FWC-SCC4]WOF16325.1 NMD protein affecting ribosome stability and mRNA decay [Methanoplanus sp. FWC-SCC4]
MDIKQNICPKCGGPSEEGLCNNCKAESVDWIICDERVQCVHCPTCGSLRHGNTWTDSHLEREELIFNLSMDAVHLHEDVMDVEVSYKYHDPSPNRTSVGVKVNGEIYGVPVESTCRVLIVWSKEQCDRCSRLAGSYYSGTIQLRADGRKPDDFEKERAIQISQKCEDELQEVGERLSFVTKSEETKDGVDIVISSHSIGDFITREIKKQLGGKVTRHPKLIGEKKGRPVYRITYLVRLPRYRKGDVFENRDHYYEVRGYDSNQLWVFDLKEGAGKVYKENDDGRLIGNVSDSESAFVNYIEGDVAGIMDPKTYENLECIIYPWLEIHEGQEVRFLRDYEKERIIFVG